MYVVIIVKLKTKVSETVLSQGCRIPFYLSENVQFYSFLSQVKSWQGTYDPNVERKKALLNGEIKPLVWYPTVYFVVCIFPLINR